MRAERWCVAAIAVAAMILSGPSCARKAGDAPPPQKRWFYLATNLYRNENVSRAESLLVRARAAGYNGVLFSDSKTFTWRALPEPERWRANAAKVRKTASDLGLEFVVCVCYFGYAEMYLAHDVNLAAGMPVRGAPLVRRGSLLVPEQTASVDNGSFERHERDRAAGFDLQDDPGKSSFIDTSLFREGRASLRFENVRSANRHGLGRIFQKIAVKPWQQYRIRVWMRTERLTAEMIQIVALDGKKPLQYQSPAVRKGDEFVSIPSANDLTTEWVEQSVTFNSGDRTSVVVGVGVWGCTGGAIWWDDLRVDAAPALNVLRRETLPLAVTAGGGAPYAEGADFERVVDPLLGRFRWTGTYDTRHEPPRIVVPAGSRIREGERVEISCYHAVIFHGSQVSCTLDDPKVFELVAEEIRGVREALAPDGYFMSHDEIRCAGWEPSQTANFRTAGELFAFNVARCGDIARREGGGKPVYVWSDMYDPYHNAHGDYYLVNGTIEKSWEGLDSGVVVMKWGKPESSAPAFRFFSRRGNRLMIAAFYDRDVEENRALWMKAAAGTSGIEGVMYTTWRDDYSKLEEFARAWWGR